MYKFQDQDLPFEARAADLVGRLTLEEKEQQLVHEAPEIPRLGIRAWNWWNEASHGVIPAVFQVFKEATSFPTCLAMSQTWNPELIEEVATVISDEMRALYNMSGKELDYWCPTVNMGRDPRWGRNDENFGEDPFLAGKLAAAYVRGIQGNDPKYLKAVSTPKHFAANNAEYNRCRGSANIDEATLREYYLPVFERCVREGGAYSIMTSYNRVNGVPSSANSHLIKEILREEWGFKGYIVSDDGAVGDVGPNTGMMFGDIRGQFYGKSMEEACGLSLNAGTDICTGTEHNFYLHDAVIQNITQEKLLDRALIRAFTARFRLGTFDDARQVPYYSISQETLCSEEHAKLARKVAAESLTLLKNEGGILPFNPKVVQKIAVIGPNAIYRQLGSYSIGGNTSIDSDTRVCIPPLAGIQAEAGKRGIDVTFAKGWQYAKRRRFGEGQQHHPVLIRAAADAGLTIDEYLKARAPEREKAFHAKRHEQFMAHFQSDKVPPRFPVVDPDLDRPDDELFAEALQAAAAADAVIVVSGTDPSVTREGWDRTTMALPYDQDGKIRQIHQANPNTVVVNISSGPAIGDFLDQIPAFLSATYAGESQGSAIADVLFGNCNPSGRTSETWYFRDEDLPHISEYGIRPFDTMTEMGRTYLYYLGQVRFPFGHGLSYTNFAYSDFHLSKDKLDANETLKVSIDVTNTGSIAGTDVLQLYFRKIALYDNKPYKQLIGFKKIFLEPGQTRKVSISVPLRELKFWNSWRARFEVEAGDYKFWFGSSSAEDAIIAEGIISASGEWAAPLSAVTLLADRSILPVGETTGLALSATLENAVHLIAGKEPIEVVSSDESVAVVVGSAVRAVSPGAVKITARLTRDGITKTDSIGLCVI